MPTEQSEIDSCCVPMHTLRNTDSQCNITLDEEDNRLIACDDNGSRLPPIASCPWYGTDLEARGATLD